MCACLEFGTAPVAGVEACGRAHISAQSGPIWTVDRAPKCRGHASFKLWIVQSPTPSTTHSRKPPRILDGERPRGVSSSSLNETTLEVTRVFPRALRKTRGAFGLKTRPGVFSSPTHIQSPQTTSFPHHQTARASLREREIKSLRRDISRPLRNLFPRRRRASLSRE